MHVVSGHAQLSWVAGVILLLVLGPAEVSIEGLLTVLVGTAACSNSSSNAQPFVPC